MKHSFKITLILLGMFFLAQLIGIAVLEAYRPEIKQVQDAQGNIINITSYNLPYGMEPPQNNNPKINLATILISLVIAITLMFFLMKFDATIILRYWFFLVITIALGITINSIIFKINYASLIALFLALPLAYIKVFKRNIFIHNTTELLIYPGIATIFVPLLSVWTIIILLILISIYDIYAVWHVGIMQKMAKYQINTLKIFSGFFIPYVSKKERELLEKLKRNSKDKKKIKVNIAILGGGDIVFPIMVAGVVLRSLGLIPALIIALGATFALGLLFYFSEKGKFYPAMPFISAGCFVALAVAYII